MVGEETKTQKSSLQEELFLKFTEQDTYGGGDKGFGLSGYHI